MNDLDKIKADLAKSKKKLIRGDQRELARRMGFHPNKIADGFDGFSCDVEFLSGLQAEALKLIRSRATVRV